MLEVQWIMMWNCIIVPMFIMSWICSVSNKTTVGSAKHDATTENGQFHYRLIFYLENSRRKKTKFPTAWCTHAWVHGEVIFKINVVKQIEIKLNCFLVFNDWVIFKNKSDRIFSRVLETIHVLHWGIFPFSTDIYCTDISGPCELSQRQEILKDTVTLKWCTTPKASSNIGN